jgi:hypothetical protein
MRYCDCMAKKSTFGTITLSDIPWPLPWKSRGKWKRGPQIEDRQSRAGGYSAVLQTKRTVPNPKCLHKQLFQWDNLPRNRTEPLPTLYLKGEEVVTPQEFVQAPIFRKCPDCGQWLSGSGNFGHVRMAARRKSEMGHKRTKNQALQSREDLQPGEAGDRRMDAEIPIGTESEARFINKFQFQLDRWAQDKRPGPPQKFRFTKGHTEDRDFESRHGLTHANNWRPYPQPRPLRFVDWYKEIGHVAKLFVHNTISHPVPLDITQEYIQPPKPPRSRGQYRAPLARIQELLESKSPEQIAKLLRVSKATIYARLAEIPPPRHIAYHKTLEALTENREWWKKRLAEEKAQWTHLGKLVYLMQSEGCTITTIEHTLGLEWWGNCWALADEIHKWREYRKVQGEL